MTAKPAHQRTRTRRFGIGTHTISNCARGGAMVLVIDQGKGGRLESETRHTSDSRVTVSIHASPKRKRREKDAA